MTSLVYCVLKSITCNICFTLCCFPMSFNEALPKSPHMYYIHFIRLIPKYCIALISGLESQVSKNLISQIKKKISLRLANRIQ